jgi:hypothetical protein
MCRDHDIYFNPIDPTTTFRPSDKKAECLTTVSIKNSIEFTWHYRNDSLKAWTLCYNWTPPILTGEYDYAGYFNIAGYWPGVNFPRAYKVDVYLDGFLAFTEFFEVTDGGLNSPRTCENIDANGYPVNLKSRFTIGTDTVAYHFLRFDDMAYFNEQTGASHNFTTVWVQPDGTTYDTHSFNFSDYKGNNTNWNCWKSEVIPDDYINISSSTPTGNWRVEVYADSYYLNSTWEAYGPVAVTPFVVGNSSVADWTFMVYLDGDNTLENASIDVFLKMASVASSPRVNVIVQLARVPGKDVRYGNWTGCKRFSVHSGMTPDPGNAVQDLGVIDMGDPNTLRDFLNWTINNYPANFYFLVLWDHGAGCIWVCYDVTYGDALSLPKLSEAMAGLPVNIDDVLMDACGMSMAEVAYQIKDSANILIGPEGLGYAPAPYDNYLKDLTSNPSMSPNAFAKKIVKDYMDWCMLANNIPSATMSATDLTRMLSLTTAIDDFASALKEEETLWHEQISLARNLTDSYEGPYSGQTGFFFDFYDFSQKAYAQISDEKLGVASFKLETALSVGNVIIAQSEKNDPASYGMAVFFPGSEADYAQFASTYESTAFAQETLWDDLVKYHLSVNLLAVQTPYPEISVKIGEDAYTADGEGKVRVYLQPGFYVVDVPTMVNSTAPDSRYVFVQWKDGNASDPRTFSLKEGGLTAQAEYETQYRLIIGTDFGVTNPSAGTHWCNADSPVEIYATPPTSVAGERFDWLYWTQPGSGNPNIPDNPSSLPMNGPVNVTAVWVHKYLLSVHSQYGSPTPLSDWFEAGTAIIESVTSPFSGQSGVQYVCTGWTGNGSAPSSGSLSTFSFVLNTSSDVEWNWKTQYLLTVRTDPAGLGPQPNVTQQGPWYDSLTTVRCFAQQVNGYDFKYWSADGSSWDVGVNPVTVTMDAPYEVVAHYVRSQAWWAILIRPDVLQALLAILGTSITVSLIGGTWFRSRKRRDIVRTFLAEVDDVYSRLKTDPQKCEEELSRLRNTVLEGLTEGRISEENYGVIDARIDKYTREVAERRGEEKSSGEKRDDA